MSSASGDVELIRPDLARETFPDPCYQMDGSGVHRPDLVDRPEERADRAHADACHAGGAEVRFVRSGEREGLVFVQLDVR